MAGSGATDALGLGGSFRRFGEDRGPVCQLGSSRDRLSLGLRPGGRAPRRLLRTLRDLGSGHGRSKPPDECGLVGVVLVPGGLVHRIRPVPGLVHRAARADARHAADGDSPLSHGPGGESRSAQLAACLGPGGPGLRLLVPLLRMDPRLSMAVGRHATPVPARHGRGHGRGRHARPGRAAAVCTARGRLFAGPVDRCVIPVEGLAGHDGGPCGRVLRGCRLYDGRPGADLRRLCRVVDPFQRPARSLQYGFSRAVLPVRRLLERVRDLPGLVHRPARADPRHEDGGHPALSDLRRGQPLRAGLGDGPAAFGGGDGLLARLRLRPGRRLPLVL